MSTMQKKINMKAMCKTNGQWELIGNPAGTTLISISITFPHATSHAGGQTGNYISGQPSVAVVIRDQNGCEQTHTDVTLEFEAANTNPA